MKSILFILLASSVIISCGASSKTDKTIYNPAATGFNMEDSDPEAIAFADSVVLAHGGREAWDNTTYIKWNFFGSRRHVWNKKTGDVIIEGLRDTFTINMNINTNEGSVMIGDRPLLEQDSLADFLDRGKRMWINDSYWLILPFKLKDSGVTLKKPKGSALRHDSIGRLEQLTLTFDGVGVTPDNKYIVTFEGESKKIHQWYYFKDAEDITPNFVTTWSDYKQYGDILLSSNRGDGNLTEISTSDTLARYFD